MDRRGGGGGSGGVDGGSSRVRLNSVFYADTYHPIQAGSIDGIDIHPHDNAVYRALLCSSAGLYDPSGDPKVIGDPYCTIFVGRLSRLTTEQTLLKAMNKYGRVKNLRLVRDIVTGASRGYAFVEYETESEMRRAYKDAHHSHIDDCEIIVDYNRQQLMPGWIPRRLGGGLGGKKESGQLRFGGRERPFRAPILPIPYNDLKKLGIPLPPEGRYMSRYQDPSPPRRGTSSEYREEVSHKRRSRDRVDNAVIRNSVDSSEDYEKFEREKLTRRRSSLEREESYRKRKTGEKDGHHIHHRDSEEHDYRYKKSSSEGRSHKRSSKDRDARSHKQHKSRHEKSSSTHET